MADHNPKGLTKCREPSADHLSERARTAVERWVGQLQADGWTLIEIAEYLGTSRTHLYRWRTGEETPRVEQYWALESLAAECAAKPRRVG